MRAICRTEGELTYFIITGVGPAYGQAVRDLIYSQFEDGFGKAYATDTPNLDRIYRNFEQYAV